MRVAPLGLHGGEVRELRGVGAHCVLVQIKSLVPLMRRPKSAPGGGASGRGVAARGVPAMDAFAAALAAVDGGEGREALEGGRAVSGENSADAKTESTRTRRRGASPWC